MPKYRVPLTTHATTTVDITTNATDPHAIAEMAAELADVELCGHCATETNLGDDWKPVLVGGTPAMTLLD